MIKLRFKVYDKLENHMWEPSEHECTDGFFWGMDGRLYWREDDVVLDKCKALKLCDLDRYEVTFLPEIEEKKS